MKKILIMFIATMFAVSLFSNNVSGYKISDDKEATIKNSLNSSIITNVNKITAKWDSDKKYEVYTQLKKAVYQLNIKTINRKDLTEVKKQKIINQYNSLIYLLEKSLDDKYMPQNTAGDSI